MRTENREPGPETPVPGRQAFYDVRTYFAAKLVSLDGVVAKMNAEIDA